MIPGPMWWLLAHLHRTSCPSVLLSFQGKKEAPTRPDALFARCVNAESLPADCRLWLKQHTCDTPPVGGSTTGVERKNGKPHVQGTISSCWAEQSGDEGAGLVVDNGSDSDELSLAQQVLRSERRSAFTALRLNCMALSIQPFAGVRADWRVCVLGRVLAEVFA